MNKVSIYADGACSGNPGPGGWAAIILYDDTETKIYGRDVQTTNNKMELTAVIKGLKSLDSPCKISLYTDSLYVKKGMTEWINKWKSNGWVTSKKKPVKNIELWKELDDLSLYHNIDWKFVKAHRGNKYNEIVDKMAKMAIVTKD